MTKALRIVALGAAAFVLGAAAPKTIGWNHTVTRTAQPSHVMGNPAAPIKLTEFVSYTCPHCAQFEVQADAPLRLGYITTGKVSVEVRHFLRDPIDLTVALLANCGAKEKFFLNHAAFMRSQKDWLPVAAAATPAQRARWTSGPLASRTRAIASDLKLYDIMARRSYDRMSADKCLADTVKADQLAKGTVEAGKLGIRGTPGLAINGELLADTHDWAKLRPQLDARLQAQ